MDELQQKRGVSRFLGGSPLAVLLRLAILSFVVGVILTVLDVNPNDIIRWIDERLRFLTSFGFETIEEVGAIIFLGAVVVVPIWLLLRVLKMIGR
ncbi:MAG: DUF6460 domain-containing protein [Pseudomonadota bacterium]